MGNVTTGSPHPRAKPVRAPTSFPRAAVVIVALAAALVGSLALKQFAWLVGPVFLALVIVTLVHPLHRWLQRHKVPRLIALLGLVVSIYGLVIVLVAALFRGLISFGATMIFFLGLLLFMAIDSVGIDSRLEMLSAKRPGLSNALRIFARDTRRFLAVTGIFGLLTGFADTLLLWWLGIPLAVLWGLLAAVCNFIPYVGFVIGLVPPALLALLDQGWHTMLLVIVVYIILNSLLTSLIAPHYLGDNVGVSTPVTVVGLVFWGWVLGPLGAILSVPLTSLLKVLLIDSDPRARWATALVGSTREHRRRYQGAPKTPLVPPSAQRQR